MISLQITIVVLAVSAGFTLAQLDSLIRVEAAAGPQVVEAVVSLIRESCVFPNDRLLLRRLAYVATSDGLDPDTFRPGFFGGIWAVKEQDFLHTQNNASLQPLYDGIRSKFNIDWNHGVQWRDLRKPLFSGIAASLYLAQTFGQNVPMSIEGQAEWYSHTFRPEEQGAGSEFYNLATQFDKACAGANLDLAFLVDSSSSLTQADFQKSKEFASDTLDYFNIGPNAVRVAFMTFSTDIRIYFDFNDLSDKTSIQQAIQAVNITGGDRATDKALAYAASTLFTDAGGSRPNAAKVAVLLTDGQADRSIDAVRNAQDLKDMGVSILVIGVGNDVDTDELNSLASEPACTHVQQLTGYQDLDALRAEIQQASCQAPVILSEGNYSFSCNTTSNIRIPTNGSITIDIKSINGNVDIYGSFLTSIPNSAFREFSTTAEPNRDSMIYVMDETRPLYLTAVAEGNDTDKCHYGTYDINVFNKNALMPDTLTTCIENGIIRPCGALDFLRAQYTVITPNLVPFTCPLGHAGYYPYPNSYLSFIYCSNDGKLYVVICSDNSWYSDGARQCIPGTPPTVTTVHPTTTQAVPDTTQQSTTQPYLANPCTQDALNSEQHFFPYPPDDTKYIHCAEWAGAGVVLECEPFHRWNQEAQACIYANVVVVDPIDNNFLTSSMPEDFSCRPGMTDGSLFFYPYPGDNTKFVQCDQYGSAFVHQCQDNKVWNQALLTCVANGFFLFPGR